MIIAEIGNNHDGDFERAKTLIHLASECGADAVKFQIYEASKLVHPKLPALVKTHATQLERMQSLQFPREKWLELHALCDKIGIQFLATCFDEENLQFWAPRMPLIKIASGDLTYPNLLRVAAISGKPVLLSTGGATDDEIAEAARFFPDYNIVVMHCMMRYPCPHDYANLWRIRHLRQLYARVGYSDHVIGIDACVVAIAKGCRYIEKHFTDVHRNYGDYLHSANPEQMEDLVNAYKQIKKMERQTPRETRPELRRGAYANKPLSSGHVVSETDIVYLRPQGRMDVVGRKLQKAVGELEAIG